MWQGLLRWFNSYWITVWGYFTGGRTQKQLTQIESVPNSKAEGLFFSFPERLEKEVELRYLYQCNCLSKYTIISDNELKVEIQSGLFPQVDVTKFSPTEGKSLACLLGMAIGDALGAPLEFSRVEYNRITLTNFEATEQWLYPQNRFSLAPGQWTDDTSMGLCLAESLYRHPEFNAIDLRIRFLNWWDFGYRNAFGCQDDLKHSVGLGGCIGSSFTEFRANRTEFTLAGDQYSSGNGSIMRLAPVPILYHRNIERALEIAYKQSKTTHQGEEAAECCRLMTFCIVSFINCPAELSPQEKKEIVFKKVKEEFDTPLYSVRCLADSKNEEEHESNKHLKLEDRQWNWKKEEFRYCETRAVAQPGYIGSYCMDGLAMALHCVWTTHSFEEALIRVVNLRGDADTVGSITGQIAGSLYGIEDIPLAWIQAIQQWDNNGDIALTALTLHRLMNKYPLP